MPLNIKNSAVEALVGELAALFGETKTETIYRALLERKLRAGNRFVKLSRREKLENVLRQEVWSRIPPDLLGKSISKQEEEELLGYGEDGV